MPEQTWKSGAMTPELFANWLVGQLDTLTEQFDGDEVFEVENGIKRQLTGEKKRQVTIKWLKGTDMRVVID